MLTYRKFLLIILLLSVLLLAAGWLFRFLDIWLVSVLLLLNAALLATGSFLVCSGLYVHALCSAVTDERKLAITFDDGPHPLFTPRVLDLLKERGVKAGFFVIGEKLKGHEHIIRRIIEEGHMIGNHSFAHVNHYGFMGTRKIIADLEKNQMLIENTCGKKVKLFRPPFGVTNPNIARAVKVLDYRVAGWSIRSFDTVKRKEAKTINRVVRRIKPGGIILFHDTHERILPLLIAVLDAAREKGYEIIRPDQLLGINAYR
jgi:peptidoglycan/xylan/chitin deacetylase (PgdA/CDA1 family)